MTATIIERQAPASDQALREALYAGRIFLLPPSASSLALARVVAHMLEEAFEADGGARLAQRRLPNEVFFARIGAIRRAIYTESAFHRHVGDLIEALGWDLERIAFDPLRLRVVAHEGERNPHAAAVYLPHRDTWYGHPNTLITWWIPLFDLSPSETFVFYPERFAQPVPNDSEVFDYDDWVRDGPSLKIGWQALEAGRTARYPAQIGDHDAGAALGFSCQHGEQLLFSGAHFHRTLPQSSGLTRYSLDVRIVDLADHAAGLGAPRVDNRSRGSALRDYIRLRAKS